MNRISVQTHIRAHNINIKYFAFHVSAVRQEIYTSPGVGWCRVSGVGCRVAGLAETITNSVKLKLKLRLSLAIFIREALKKNSRYLDIVQKWEGGRSEKSQTFY